MNVESHQEALQEMKGVLNHMSESAKFLVKIEKKNQEQWEHHPQSFSSRRFAGKEENAMGRLNEIANQADDLSQRLARLYHETEGRT